MLGFFSCIYIYDVFANLNNLPNKTHQKVERNTVVRRKNQRKRKNIYFLCFLFVWPNLIDTNNKSCFLCVLLFFFHTDSRVP